ncbi:MAG TPA: hypothetical protein VGP28_08185 [Methylocella sp.]|nr:hypothetical protein [Methylocella sp.]
MKGKANRSCGIEDLPLMTLIHKQEKNGAGRQRFQDDAQAANSGNIHGPAQSMELEIQKTLRISNPASIRVRKCLAVENGT